MTQASPLIRFAGKVAARDLTRAVYSGLLDRDPDEGGAVAYRHAFQHGGDLADVIKCIVSSTEFRERFLRQYAGDLLFAVYRGLLQRDPTQQDLTVAMSSSADLTELLRTLGTSEEHWQAQLERKATGLAYDLAERLQADMCGRNADAPATVAGGAVDGMVRWLATVTQADEYGAALFRRRASAVINEIYSALLNRTADPVGLAVYTAQLTSASEIGPIVKKIAASEEHWHVLLRGHAEQLVNLSFRHLLNRDPGAQELAEKAGALSTAAALGELLEILGTSEEHWNAQLNQRAPELADEIAYRLELDVHGDAKDIPAAVTDSALDTVVQRITTLTRSDEYGAVLFRRHAASLVNDIYSGLLNRTADPEGSAVYTAELTAPSDIGAIVQKIANSEEHWHTLIRSHAEQLVGLSYKKLLNRDPSSQELAQKADALSTPAALGELLRTLGASDELWKAQLERRAAELADEIVSKLHSDVHAGDIDTPAAVPGSPVENLVARIGALTRSDDYGAILFRRHAASLVDQVYLALLNRPADPEGLALYTEQLTTPAAFGSVVKDIADSEEYRRRHLHSLNGEIVAAAHTCLLQRPATPEELASHEGQGVNAVLEALAQSEELWQLQLRRRAPALANGVAGVIASTYAACSLPAPSTAELESLIAVLESPEDLQRFVGGLVLKAISAEKNAAAIAPLAVNIKDLPPVSFLAHWQTSAASLTFVDGFYPVEDGFAWSTANSSLIVTKRINIVLGCNYLRPGDSRRVTIESEGLRRTVTLNDATGCCRIEIGADRPQLVHFKAEGELVPAAEGSGADTRTLSFQLWVSDPETLYVENFWETELRHRSPLIYCVFDSKKEEDSLCPIHDRFAARDFHTVLLSAPDAIEDFNASGYSEGVFLVASFKGYNKLFNAGCRGRFIYAEHGASPLKAYTYAAHYRRYDLILLPGPLWVQRLSRLYPELAARAHAVGYAKLKDSRALSATERTAMCLRLGLDPAGKIVLFAPTWSGGDRGCGIFNLKHFARSNSLLTIPHDGDWEFAEAFKDAGYLIHTPARGESISDYYPLADVLVSDVSSTAVEFAALGKPVLCIATQNIPDFDMEFRATNGLLQIPHTGEHWDFCPTVPADQVDRELADLLDSKPRRGVRARHSRRSKSAAASVAAMICARGATAADLAVDAILKYLNAPPNRLGHTQR